MATDRILYFAKKGELNRVVDQLLGEFEISFIESGLFDNPKRNVIDFKSNSELLEDVPFGNWIANKRYLITQKDSNIVIRKIEQKRGGIKYAIDSMENPNSLSFCVGGEYEKGIIIGGEIYPNSKTDFTSAVFKFMKKLFKERFRKHGEWMVSNEISSKERLTININSSEEYDLHI